MEAPQTNPQQSYTILRIKRKRNEEPLDALVVESRRKKSRGSVNVFQFLDTVEPSAWEDEKRKRELESHLEDLARETSKRDAHVEPPSTPAPTKSANEATHPRAPAEERKYTIVPTDSTEAPRPSKHRRINAPPKVHDFKDLQKASFTMYDAVSSPGSLASATAMAVDPEIEKFLPMLQDYLKINEVETTIPVPPLKKPKPAESTGTPAKDEDYVFDVFLSRPAHAHDLSRLTSNIATLTGLPEDGIYASDSDSEDEDEDDEDSNGEDWYTNDYPDEESSDDSDAFHDGSDYEEVVYDARFNRITA